MLSGIKEIKHFRTSNGSTLSARLREWVEVTDGVFSVTDCYRDLGLVTAGDKNTCRVTLKRLVEEGLIERYGALRGTYRRIEGGL